MTTDAVYFAKQLSSAIKEICPKQTSFHGGEVTKEKEYVPSKIRQSTHVYVRKGHVLGPLEQTYEGPHPVLKFNENTVTILKNNKEEVVSLKRVKPANLNNSSNTSTKEQKEKNRYTSYAAALCSSIMSQGAFFNIEEETKKRNTANFVSSVYILN